MIASRKFDLFLTRPLQSSNKLNSITQNSIILDSKYSSLNTRFSRALRRLQVLLGRENVSEAILRSI